MQKIVGRLLDKRLRKNIVYRNNYLTINNEGRHVTKNQIIYVLYNISSIEHEQDIFTVISNVKQLEQVITALWAIRGLKLSDKITWSVFNL